MRRGCDQEILSASSLIGPQQFVKIFLENTSSEGTLFQLLKESDTFVPSEAIESTGPR